MIPPSFTRKRGGRGRTCGNQKRASRSASNDGATAELTAQSPNEERSLPESTISMADSETMVWPHNAPLFDTNMVVTGAKIYILK